jgi:dienelactone hydrolase
MVGFRILGAVVVLYALAACSSESSQNELPVGAAGQAGQAPMPASAGSVAPAPAGASGAGGAPMSTPVAGQGQPPMATAGGGAGMSGMGGMSAGAGGMEDAGTAGAAGTDAGSSAGGSGGAAPTAGGFPRSGEEINVKAKGPYTVKTYTDGLKVSEYSSAVMYYPEDAAPPFAAVALAPGYTASGTDYEFVGDMLASHGIAALLTTPTDTNADQPPARGDDLVAAVKHLMEENARSGSPLEGKLATDRICVTGQSMGGGGTLYAANQLGDMIRCALPMEPWQPGGTFPKITAPIMLIGAASDTVAPVSSHADPHYKSIPDSTEKFLVVFEGDHYLSTDRTSGIPQGTMAVANESYDPQAAYMVPFYKLFLESDERYRPYLYGDMRSMNMVTRFDHSKM